MDAMELTSAARWQRICEILHRAAYRVILEGGTGRVPPPADMTKDQELVLKAIETSQGISPETLLMLVPISRSSLTRILAALRKRGLVERTGKTRQTVYTVSAKQKSMTETVSKMSCLEQPEELAPSPLCAAHE